MLELLYQCQQMLAEIAGLPAVSLQPAAGAQGELTACWWRQPISATGRSQSVVLIPDGAHGTNPASAAMAGFETVTGEEHSGGLVGLDDLRARLDDRTAVIMITNPNTLGMFETHIARSPTMVHADGGLIYLDGANMNAILGITRPGDFGADLMHFNPHKTFSGPHGGGGPGAGPIAVAQKLAPYLPVAGRRARRRRLPPGLRPAQFDRPRAQLLRQYGRAGSGVLLHSHAWPRGIAEDSENAVLNANYLLSRVKDILPVPQGDRCMHEFVAIGREAQGRARTSRRWTSPSGSWTTASTPDSLFPVDRQGSDHGRADGNRKQGHARRLRQNAALHRPTSRTSNCTMRPSRRRSAGRTKSAPPDSRCSSGSRTRKLWSAMACHRFPIRIDICLVKCCAL